MAAHTDLLDVKAEKNIDDGMMVRDLDLAVALDGEESLSRFRGVVTAKNSWSGDGEEFWGDGGAVRCGGEEH